ncbi:hypothetical protein GCM10009679_76620 [Saccharothrix algeriensis]|uniref:Uncharacterized protein n=1 Tax=Catellatospora bangladeshensis TaxID=310355 RepID=A0A8J3NNP9_9ACTN|nr:hypothetical protein Cba03nite_76870 [Catellatospora bangladeshensis]
MPSGVTQGGGVCGAAWAAADPVVAAIAAQARAMSRRSGLMAGSFGAQVNYRRSRGMHRIHLRAPAVDVDTPDSLVTAAHNFCVVPTTQKL